MTIDEAIERCTSNAEYERTHGNLQGCLEFRQLVEWLKDYKRLKEQEPKTGHWIYIGNGHNGLNKCSECGGERKMFDGLEKYCASCGCRMVKPQETKQPEISSFYGLKSYVRERSEE